MRRIILLVAVALVGLVAAPREGSAQQPQKARPPLGIEKVTDDLYVIIGNGGNVAVLVTNEGVVLVDDKFEEDYAAIIAQVKTVTPQPVKYVFNTHHHSDHSGGNTRFIEVAEIISHKNARANIEGKKQSNTAPTEGLIAFMPPRPGARIKSPAATGETMGLNFSSNDQFCLPVAAS